jgi:hypothetical protein
MTAPADRRPEPEIIPPSAPLPRHAAEQWTASDDGGARYVHIRPIGPLGAALLTLGVGAVAGVALLFLLGTAIIGLAAIGVLAVAGAVAGILRGPPRPLR